MQKDLPADSKGRDCYLWQTGGVSRESFSVSHTWEDIRNAAPSVTWYEAVWFKGHTPKHAFTFWVTNKGRLPLRPRLLKWGIGSSDLCYLCNRYEETREHLFLHCEVSIQITRLLLARLGEPTTVFADWSSFITWMLGPSPFMPKIIKLLATQSTVFYLWKERNARLHDNVSRSANVIFRLVDRSVRDAILARNKTKASFLLSSWFLHKS
ncbi:unnamed protein product [Thlaspi arvense]|uniref:Reverse transcriptase zinc-binding domain-containing protein n=1 Tax=Thlaspi arvense TaxID=13288 RepID=A0AAU9S957_THLAR|nr:unnamed protein product [Thlaspi arvense]